MLMNADKSVLLIIDVQARLAPAIHETEKVLEACVWLTQVAERLAIPVVVTEHFPDKLGATLPALREVAGAAQFVTKEYFSAVADGCLDATAVATRSQVVICGTEAHVCVQQTALDLRAQGKDVFVVTEASGSRDPANRELAFARMRSRGLDIVSREMVAFEWLQRGGTEAFRSINRDFIR